MIAVWIPPSANVDFGMPKYLYAFASFLLASALSSTRSLRLIYLSSLFMVIVYMAVQK
ncbi:hypothetical protein SAMN04488071_0156 [Kordiimonas lacus]|uniref:Uncharacterized protein n=1 Tax=Kordiimonas lacus TaxID=637679 RepID=A0A1G6T8N4_9PROT|nr:hypothetical protein [Kordiimonas lacus]SDD25399.1 hypothetical protein SAMN04488071_0156 [Kordiimonas lacus]